MQWRRDARVLAGAIVMLLIGGALIHYGSARPRHRLPRRHVIEIRGLAFHADSTPVLIGDTVVWSNHDIFPHTATALDKSWDSGTILPGTESPAIVIATDAGRSYFCALHPNMTATLTAP